MKQNQVCFAMFADEANVLNQKMFTIKRSLLKSMAQILLKMTTFFSGNLKNLKPRFHWTAIPLRSWRSRIFSKIIPNRRESVDSHTIWGLNASSTLPLRFYYASVTLLLRSHYDNEDLTTLIYADDEVAATLLRPWRWSYAFVTL